MIRKMFSRDFILGFFSQLIFSFVVHLLTPTLPIYLSRAGSTEVEIGILIGIYGVTSLLSRPFIGRELLKISEKRIMIVGTLLFTLTSIAYLLSPPFWPFFIVRCFQGISFGLYNTASFLLIANISPETHRGQSLGYFLLAPNISLAMAPAFGMFLINQFSFTLLFYVCSGLSLGSLFIANKLGTRQVVTLENSSIEDAFFLSRKALPPSIISFFFSFSWGAVATFFPLYAIKSGVSNPGPFFTAMAITLILGRGLGSKILDLYSKEKIILPCLFTCIISMIILAFSKTLPMFILVAVIWGIGHAFIFPSLMAYALERAGSSRGPAMGTFTAFSDFGLAIGPVIMGIIIHTASYQIMFLCLALTGIINLSYFYFFVRIKG
jgi:MFS family permease